jgi:dihydrofolate synthase/folylpolyglutamate synthase
MGQEFSLIISEMFYLYPDYPDPLPSKGMRKEWPTGREYRLEIPLLGKHQIVNAATAVGAIEILKSSGFPISTNAIEIGLKAVRLPGRIQILRRTPTIIVDTSHNVASAKALCETIVETFNYNKCVLIAGFLLDKEIGKIGFELCPLADTAILTKAANTPRAAEPKNILQQWKDMCHNIKTGDRSQGSGNKKQETGKNNINIIVTQSVGEALRVAESMVSEDDLICITGSFYIAGEALEILGYEA